MAPKPRVIAIDDNEDTLEIIRTALVDDYDVLTLSDPLDMTEMIELFEPDLAILDIMMPRVSGFQLTEMLHRSKKTQDMPVILLSAKNSPRDIKHGYRMGAALYLTKPFMPDRLLKNVKTQFEMTPPSERPKRLNLLQMRREIMTEQGKRMGEIQLATRDSSTEVPSLDKLRALHREHQQKS